MSRTLLGTECRQQPAGRANKQLADEERKISERSVGSFLARRRDGGGVFVDARRIEGLPNRKDVVHLQEDRCEETDEEEEKQKPVETGLAEQPMEETQSVDGALPHGLTDATQERGSCAIRFVADGSISASAKEVNHGEKQN